jgi:hypothetical protein
MRREQQRDIDARTPALGTIASTHRPIAKPAAENEQVMNGCWNMAPIFGAS